MSEDYLTRGEKEYLLKIARISLEKFVAEEEKYEPQTVNSKLWEKRGVFVTLTKEGELRGCMGYTEALEPIILSVRDNTLAAARDPRFEPIDRSELKDINIEISILSESELVTLNEINKGDGVIIRKGDNSATYLPQVWEQLPDKKDFFESLCQKAGLDRNAYLDRGMEFYKYSVDNFFEDK